MGFDPHFFNPDLSSLRRDSTDHLFFSYCQLLQREFLFRKERGLDFLSLRSYYKNLFAKDDALISIGVLGYAQRLTLMVEELRNLSSSVKILDAGCGYGTESILLSLLGHEVTGIELVKERVDIACSRIDFFQSACKFPLNLRFINANIFKFLQDSEPFDVIWAMEAISHIYPPEQFLSLVFNKLEEGGKLVVTDPNSLNLLALLRSVKIRGSLKHSPHKRFKDPETGIPVDYGQEKIFSVLSFKRTLAKIGFKIKKIQMSGFMGTTFLPRSFLRKKTVFVVLASLQKIIQNFPALRLLGSIYTIVASKERPT